jgi:hypothetical protein
MSSNDFAMYFVVILKDGAVVRENRWEEAKREGKEDEYGCNYEKMILFPDLAWGTPRCRLH